MVERQTHSRRIVDSTPHGFLRQGLLDSVSLAQADLVESLYVNRFNEKRLKKIPHCLIAMTDDKAHRRKAHQDLALVGHLLTGGDVIIGGGKCLFPLGICKN